MPATGSPSRAFPRPRLDLRRLPVGKILAAGYPPALRMGGALLQFLATIWIARTLGENRSGDFFFWSAILMSFATIATFGLDKLALQQVPRLHDDPPALSRFLGGIRSISIVLAIVIGFLLIAYAAMLQSQGGRSLLWYALLPIGLVGLVLCKLNAEALKGLAHPLLAVHYRNILPASIFLIALLVAGSALTPESALLCFAAGFVLAGVASFRSRAFRGLHPHLCLPGKEETRAHLASGLPICVGAVLNAFNYMVPLTILERCHPSADVAFLTTAYRLFVLFELLAAAVQSLSMPALSRAAHESDWKLSAKIYGGSIRYGLLILALPLIGIIYFAAPVMSLFGDGFVGADSVLVVFLLFGLVSLALGPADDLILMMGKTRRLAVYTGINLLLTVALAFWVIPAFGPVGMAALFGAGIVLKKILCLTHFYRHARTHNLDGK